MSLAGKIDLARDWLSGVWNNLYIPPNPTWAAAEQTDMETLIAYVGEQPENAGKSEKDLKRIANAIVRERYNSQNFSGYEEPFSDSLMAVLCLRKLPSARWDLIQKMSSAPLEPTAMGS